MRTINLHLAVIPAVRDAQAAIGYLSLWGFPSFPVVDIHPDGKTDLLAVYTDPENSARRYVIGAIWRSDENRYTFHS